MKAFYLVQPGQMELRNTQVPKPEEGELIIKIESALTCGTDLKAFRRGHPKMPMPTPFGHEFSGVIADAGASVNGYREGDAIMGVHTAPCGDCYYCRRQFENLCSHTMKTMLLGAYAEYIKLPRRVVDFNTFHKPDSLTFAEAAMLEPLSCVVHGLQSLKVQPEDTVLVVGAGAIGLLHVLCLKAMGAERIIVAGKHEQRLNLAKEVGAEIIIDASQVNTIEMVREVTGGFGANWVFECTGRPEVWEQSIDMVSKGGNVILFGGCATGTAISFDTGRLHYDEISLHGSFHFTPRDVKKACELLTEKQIDVSKLISGDYPLRELNLAFDQLIKGEGIKYAIRP